MLKAVLANQKADSRDAKLDELLDLARKAANPYGTTTTYAPNGTTHSFTLSTGTFAAGTEGLADFQAMAAKSQSRDWSGLLDSAQKARDEYPGWFTPFMFIGLAQINLCQTEDGLKSLKQFMADSEGATGYEDLRGQVQKWVSNTNTLQYAVYCSELKVRQK
jgi:hypothetical protein